MGETVNAGEICNRIVTCVDRNELLNRAARLMREHHVGCLVVIDETPQGRVVVGMLTDRDIVTAVVAEDVDAATLRVEDVMSGDVVTALEQDSVMDLLSSMRRKGVRRIPIVGLRGELLGLVTLDDLLQIVGEELDLLVQAIETEQRRERTVRPAAT